MPNQIKCRIQRASISTMVEGKEIEPDKESLIEGVLLTWYAGGSKVFWNSDLGIEGTRFNRASSISSRNQEYWYKNIRIRPIASYKRIKALLSDCTKTIEE